MGRTGNSDRSKWTDESAGKKHRELPISWREGQGTRTPKVKPPAHLSLGGEFPARTR